MKISSSQTVQRQLDSKWKESFFIFPRLINCEVCDQVCED